MGVPRSTVPDEERFLSYAALPNGRGCRLWLRGTRLGYGMFHFWEGDRRRSLSAHVWAYRHFIGDIPPGLVVRHACDEGRCVEPSHLLVGTQAQNIADKVNRNRQAKGERNGSAKLTAAQVRAIRTEYSSGQMSQRDLAARYNVAQTTIGKIVRRDWWRHVA